MAARTEAIRKLLGLTALPGGLAAFCRARVRSVSALSIVLRLKAAGVAPGHIIDVGANRGQFAAACRAVFPGCRVTAIEPIPELADRLRQTFAGDNRVQVVNAALGARAETRPFHVNAFSPSSSFLPLGDAHKASFPDAVDTQALDMAIIPLDELISVEGLPPVDLLKLDVQGFELEVLKGATGLLGRVPHVLAETSFRPLYEGEPTMAEITGYLSPYGFACVGALDMLPAPDTGLMVQADLLFSRQTP